MACNNCHSPICGVADATRAEQETRTLALANDGETYNDSWDYAREVLEQAQSDCVHRAAYPDPRVAVLAAEVATLRAALPKWRRQDKWIAERGECWRLCYVGTNDVWYVIFTASYDHNTVSDAEFRSGDYAGARKRAEELLGLLPCEVVE